MPIKVPAGLPALEIVRGEGVEIKELTASASDTLRIALLNYRGRFYTSSGNVAP